MIIVPETLIIMNNLTQYLLTLMFIPQVGRNLPGCPGHDLLPAPGALAQCGGRAHEGNIFPIKLFSNIYMYPYILLAKFLVRNARGKIIEEAQEKRDALIVTFQVAIANSFDRHLDVTLPHLRSR